jgi:phenylacetate-CoA ligase
MLREDARRLIQDVFDTHVYDFYGSRECGGLAGECRCGLMHILSFNQQVEVVNDADQEVASGEQGRVVVTTLHNRAMPLLRFEIGDLAVKGPSQCRCGSVLPTLQAVQGRISDNFVTRDGTVVHGEYFTHLFYYRECVRQFQVIQESYDHIRTYVSLHPGMSLPQEDREEISAKIRLAMGADCTVEYAIVEEIPKSPQGKFLFTFSKVSSR